MDLFSLIKKNLLLAVLCCLVLIKGFANEQIITKTILLDCLELNKMEQSTGRPHIVSERANLSIGGRRFLNGVPTRTESSLYLELDGKVSEFSAEVGVDDRSTLFRNDTVKKENSWAQFFVIGDGKVLWQSGEMKYGEYSKPVKVNLSGVKNLLLKVTGGPGNTHVDWVDAKFNFSGAIPETVWSPEAKVNIVKSTEFVHQQNLKYPVPRINGAMKVGVRPNTEFYYPMAVTGLRPMKYAAENIPEGLVLDEKTGIISGTSLKAGEYNVRLTASNTKGEAQRILRIVVGDKLALTPPMGYLSWNVVEGLINEAFLKELADVFVQFGLRDVGYQYINMDGCWQGGRDAGGRVYPDQFRFPNGMKVVGDYLHEKGLKFGIYSTPGPIDCAGYTGTMNFEESDVESWISWGVDYLKYDGCTTPPERSAELYRKMGDLLRQSGRSVVYCGKKDAGSQLWRVGGDLRDQWSLGGRDVGIVQSFKNAQNRAGMQEPGRWNDPDMLVVGIRGKGSSGNDKTDEKGCTDEEYRSHMSLWALMSAPLFITADVRQIDPVSLEILTNPEVIEVNQDPLGKFPVRLGEEAEQEIWVKEMEDGSKTVALLNKASVEKEMKVKWEEIGLKGSHLVRDLWHRKDMGKFKSLFSSVVPSHGVVLVRIY